MRIVKEEVFAWSYPANPLAKCEQERESVFNENIFRMGATWKAYMIVKIQDSFRN